MKLELTKKGFVAKYPVGTRILWNNRTRSDNWLPGTVIEPRKEHPKFDPSVSFLLDSEKGQDIDYAARFIGYEYQHLIKLAI